ncbi:hypothetical protein [Halorussus salinisoli]|uniref:hypothetical protein n=1 Tax=Halorussus salinisoli TaxID=2558242 RepID=UPI0010C241EB|nr:hypothetical protein [Halorussus salinisoli]
MSVPGGIDADRGPPMAIPLAHFVAGFGFLLAGAALGVVGAAGVSPGLSRAADVHLLLVGWVCVTILGAMTQFVPVWSGVELHSRRLAVAQLALVAGGVAGFAGLLVTARLDWLPVAGAAMLAGFWTFVYNVGRTLWSAASGESADETAGLALDPTERHFALALGYVLVVTALGFLLALDFVRPTLAPAGLARSQVVAAHATLAVFGVVLTTVVGALYQLATMFTQTELHGVDTTLQRVEEVAYPVGVVALAGGRLVDATWVGRIGALLVLTGLLAFAAVLARKLSETRVEQTPMLSRYAVVALALPAWALAAAPAWLADPTDPVTTFGHPSAGHLLTAAVVGFVLLGTLYHVVPFIVWVRQYSDRVGLEPVPMIDDLYDGRLAAADFWLTLGGLGLVILGEVGAVGTARLVGAVAATLGFAVFSANLVGVVVRHGPESLRIGAVGSPAAESGDPDEQFP